MAKDRVAHPSRELESALELLEAVGIQINAEMDATRIKVNQQLEEIRVQMLVALVHAQGAEQDAGQRNSWAGSSSWPLYQSRLKNLLEQGIEPGRCRPKPW